MGGCKASKDVRQRAKEEFEGGKATVGVEYKNMKQEICGGREGGKQKQKQSSYVLREYSTPEF